VGVTPSGNETLDDLRHQHDTTLAYWRKNCRQYPPEGIWDRYYFDLLRKTFESRHELWAWCESREKQLKDPVYLEEPCKLQMKDEEEKRLAQEAKQLRRRETPATWEHYIAEQGEVNRRAKEADLGGTCSKTWPPP
jgi:hypothetical protein